MNKFSLSQYVSTVKNLRGVVYFYPQEATEAGLKWIANKFKYRTIGIASALFKEVKEEELRSKLSKRPFVLLASPFPGLGKWVEAMAQLRGVNFAAAESLTLASAFVSPMLIVGGKAVADFSAFIIWQLQSTAKLSDQEIKRHLRIADYAVLDFHQEMTLGAYEVLTKLNSMQDRREDIPLALIDQRRTKAQADGEKRFWRLRQQGETMERILVAYLDPLTIFPKLPISQKKNLLDIFSSYPEEVNLGLSIVAAFIVEI